MDVTFKVSCICRVNRIEKKNDARDIETMLTECFLKYLGFSDTAIHVFDVKYHNEEEVK